MSDSTDRNFQDIVEGLPQTVYEIDLTGRIVYANERGLELTGLSVADLEAGPNAAELFAPEDRGAVMGNLKKIIEHGDIGPSEYTLVTSAGQRIPVMVYSRAIIKNGRPVGFRGVLLDLTDRNKIVDELRASEARYRHLVDGAQVGILVHSEGKVVFANPKAAEIFGLDSYEQLLGFQMLDLVPSDVREATSQRIQRIYDKSLSGGFLKGKFLRSDGTVFPVEATGVAIDYGGRPASQVMFSDVTWREEAMEELRQFGQMFENAEFGIALVDATGETFIRANSAYARMYGYSREEMDGMPVVDVIAPSERHKHPALIAIIHERGHSVFQTENMKKDGTIFPVEVDSTSVRDDQGNVLYRISNVTDLSEQRRAETVLMKVARGVSATSGDSFFRELVGHMAEALDADFAFVGKLVEERPGVVATEVVVAHGKSADNFEYDLAGTPCADAASGTSCLFQGVQEGFPADQLLIDMDVRGYVGAPLTLVDGTVWGILVVLFQRPVPMVDRISSLVDIFAARVVAEIDRVLAEERRHIMELQLLESQKTESIGRLAGGIAHDINNLITPILGYSDMLLNGTSIVDDENRKYVESIHGAAERTKSIIDQLSSFGRRQTLEVRVANVGEVLGGLKDILKRTIREDIHFEIVPGKTLWNARVDVVRIEQVIVNLVVNSGDSMPQGGTLRISVFDGVTDCDSRFDWPTPPHGDWVCLEVRDTGTGMDRRTKEMVFEPFFTTKPKGQGTGLGLATVIGIVKQHSGRVDIGTEVGVGTTMRVLLPRCSGSEGHAHPAAVEISPRHEVTNQAIMVVEDEPAVKDLVVAVLERLGYRVYSAGGPKECLAMLDSLPAPISLLLTDVIMPGMNGRDLYDLLSEKISGLQVLFMSGYTDDVLGPSGVVEGGFAFLQKPFSAKTLGARVRELLAQKEQGAGSGEARII